jgi:hypothetical protein
VRLYGATRHVELSSDFVVVAALQKQLDDLLFALPKADGFFAHSNPPQDVLVKLRAHRSCSPLQQD